MRRLAFVVSCFVASAALANDNAADGKRRATPAEVFRAAAEHFYSHCGHPSHCSMTIDPRGGCPITAVLSSPEPLGTGSEAFTTKLGKSVYLAWICFSPSGRILDVQFIDKTPWLRS